MSYIVCKIQRTMKRRDPLPKTYLECQDDSRRTLTQVQGPTEHRALTAPVTHPKIGSEWHVVKLKSVLTTELEFKCGSDFKDLKNTAQGGEDKSQTAWDEALFHNDKLDDLGKLFNIVNPCSLCIKWRY